MCRVVCVKVVAFRQRGAFAARKRATDYWRASYPNYWFSDDCRTYSNYPVEIEVDNIWPMSIGSLSGGEEQPNIHDLLRVFELGGSPSSC